MHIIGAGSIAVRPSAFVDRETTVAMPRMKSAVLGRLALPVDDVSRRQNRVLPNATRRNRFVTPVDYFITRCPVRHYRTSWGGNCVAALLGCRTHVGL